MAAGTNGESEGGTLFVNLNIAQFSAFEVRAPAVSRVDIRGRREARYEFTAVGLLAITRAPGAGTFYRSSEQVSARAMS